MPKAKAKTKEKVTNIMKVTNDGTFDEDIMNGALPSLILVTAKWSGPSQVMIPLVETISRNYKGKFEFFHMNAEDSTGTIAKLGIKVAPSLVYIEDSRIKGIRMKNLPEDHIVKFISSMVS